MIIHRGRKYRRKCVRDKFMERIVEIIVDNELYKDRLNSTALK